MKSITIHSIDDQLAIEIKRRALASSVSMNEFIKRVLAESLGLKASSKGRHREDFEGFCQTWTEDDLREFEACTADTETVNPEDWR